VALTLPTVRHARPRIALGLAGLAVACAVRLAVAGRAGAASISAGVVFGAIVAMIAVAIRSGAHRRPLGRSLGIGVLGGTVLCVPALARHLVAGSPLVTGHGYLPWALGVVVVAGAEEALLRGSLFVAVENRAGTVAAVALTSVAFALLHVPLYGWAVVPLDLAVGVWLGVLRAAAGSAVAPGVAHALADLAGWWLR
jgi:uncharacterized protein